MNNPQKGETESRESRDLMRFQSDGVYLKEGTSIAFFPWVELMVVSSEDHQTCFVGASRRVVIRTSLSSIEAELSSQGFVRINRQLIINLRNIKKIVMGPKARVYLTNGLNYGITRRRRALVVKAHEDFLAKQAEQRSKQISLRTVRDSLQSFGVEKLWTPIGSKVRQYLREQPDLSLERRQAFDFLAQTPMCQWLGSTNTDLIQDVRPLLMHAQAAQEVPVFVIFRLFLREETKRKTPNLLDLMNYKQWIRSLVQAIAHYKCIVILEPNALSMMDEWMPLEVQDTYYEALRFAIMSLRRQPQVRIYLDAGHAAWVPPHEISLRLARAGIDYAHGFAVNVSNFIPLDESYEYGRMISGLLGQKSFVIDTSRNGQPRLKDPGNWCNPPDRGLGRSPTLQPKLKGVDALLWVKPPGESDGAGRSSQFPEPGEWWPAYAWDLCRLAKLGSS